jgi:type II secretory pathway pseudopilin PulG
MTRRELLIVVLIVVVLAAALLPALRVARIAGERSERENNLKQIGLAIRNFHDVYRQPPQAVLTDEEGRPLSSWRFQLLPFLEAIMRDVDFSLPWDHPDHEYFSSFGWPTYCLRNKRKGPERLCTNVMAVTGRESAFDDWAPTFSELPPDLILVIEVPDTDIHWMQPGDIDIDEIDESILKGPDGGGIHVLFKDGSVVFIPRDTRLETLKRFLTVEGAKQHDRKILLPQG